VEVHRNSRNLTDRIGNTELLSRNPLRTSKVQKSILGRGRIITEKRSGTNLLSRTSPTSATNPPYITAKFLQIGAPVVRRVRLLQEQVR